MKVLGYLGKLTGGCAPARSAASISVILCQGKVQSLNRVVPPPVSGDKIVSMTLREYFRARSKRARRVFGVGVLVIAVSVAILVMNDHFSRDYSYAAAGAGVLGVATMFGGMLYLDLTKCPQCLTRLGFHFVNQYRFGRSANFCPFCGVGFDKCEMRST